MSSETQLPCRRGGGERKKAQTDGLYSQRLTQLPNLLLLQETRQHSAPATGPLHVDADGHRLLGSACASQVNLAHYQTFHGSLLQQQQAQQRGLEQQQQQQWRRLEQQQHLNSTADPSQVLQYTQHSVPHARNRYAPYNDRRENYVSIPASTLTASQPSSHITSQMSDQEVNVRSSIVNSCSGGATDHVTPHHAFAPLTEVRLLGSVPCVYRHFDHFDGA